MSAHLSNQIIENFKLRTLTSTEILEVDDHICICKRCRERLLFDSALTDAVPLLEAELRSMPGLIPSHMHHQQLSFYVDAQLTPPDLEVVEEHLNTCTDCAADLHDLALFSLELEREDCR